MKTTGLYIIILVLIGVICWLVYSCYFKDASIQHDYPGTENVIVVDTVVDTIYVRKTSYIPKIIYRDTMSRERATKFKDTTLILNDNHIYNVIVDTVTDDSISRMIITDTLFMNTIISRTPRIKYTIRDIKTTVLLQQHLRPGIYGGLMACGNMNKFGIGVSANYVIPKKSNIGLSYDFVNKQVFVSYSRYLF